MPMDSVPSLRDLLRQRAGLLKSPVVLAIVSGCLLSLVACQGPYRAGSGSDDGRTHRPNRAAKGGTRAQPDQTILAIVGDHAITAGELRTRILDRFYTRRALEGLIKERLFRDEAMRLGLTVTDDEVNARVEAEMAQLKSDVGGNQQAFANALASQGTNEEERRRELFYEHRNMLLIEKVVHAQRKSWGVTEKALRTVYAETYATPTLRLRHIAFPVRRVPGSASEATEALAAVQREAQAVRAELDGGADFADLARKHSRDPVTAKEGGLLGWVPREALPPGLAEEVFRLPIGQPSDPMRQESYGYHIFLVEERRESQPFEVVRAKLEEQILRSPPSPREIQSISETLRGEGVTILNEPVATKGASPGASIRKERR